MKKRTQIGIMFAVFLVIGFYAYVFFSQVDLSLDEKELVVGENIVLRGEITMNSQTTCEADGASYLKVKSGSKEISIDYMRCNIHPPCTNEGGSIGTNNLQVGDKVEIYGTVTSPLGSLSTCYLKDGYIRPI